MGYLGTMAEHDLVISVEEAVRRLQHGEVVAIPTETVYGLAARIDDEGAIRRIFSLKGRPADNPLIVHVATRAQVANLAKISDVAATLMDRFWPGPLTIVLPKNDGVSDLVTAGLDTVAVRMPASPTAIEILRRLDVPLAAPSANRSGRPSATQAQHVLDDHGDAVAVVDGGACQEGLESTVVRPLADRILLLRPGVISRSDLTEATGLPVVDPDVDDVRRSPGTRHRHYAPAVPVELFDDLDDLRRSIGNGNVVILAETNPHGGGIWKPLTGPTVFTEFRDAERLGVDKILVHLTEAVRTDEALMNRLRRASEPANDETSNS